MIIYILIACVLSVYGVNDCFIPLISGIPCKLGLTFLLHLVIYVCFHCHALFHHRSLMIDFHNLTFLKKIIMSASSNSVVTMTIEGLE